MPKSAKRIRSVVVVEDSWFKRQITAGNMLSVATIAFGFAAFYFNTSSAIETQAKAISAIERKINEAEKRDEKQQVSVIQERATLRAEMTARAEKTADGIAELNKQTAVLSTQLGSIKDQLVKIGEQLTTSAARVAK